MASKPRPEKIDELLSRRPGMAVPNGLTPESVDRFFAEQRAKYPQNYANERRSSPSILTKDPSPMSQHYVAQYTDHYRRMGKEPDLRGIDAYAREYAASAELQAEFRDWGGFVAFAAQKRACDQGLVKILGSGRR